MIAMRSALVGSLQRRVQSTLRFTHLPWSGSRLLHERRPILAVRNTNHDIGGAETLLHEPLPTEKPNLPWELECHALFAILASDGVLRTDMLRRAIESLPIEAHTSWSYYELWSAAMANLLRETGNLQPGELEAELAGDDTSGGATPLFEVGAHVVVRTDETRRTAWRPPHLRTPGYIFGVSGIVERHCGAFADPSLLAFGVPSEGKQHLYRVRFRQTDLWPEYHSDGNTDTVRCPT